MFQTSIVSFHVNFPRCTCNIWFTILQTDEASTRINIKKHVIHMLLSWCFFPVHTKSFNRIILKKKSQDVRHVFFLSPEVPIHWLCASAGAKSVNFPVAYGYPSLKRWYYSPSIFKWAFVGSFREPCSPSTNKLLGFSGKLWRSSSNVVHLSGL